MAGKTKQQSVVVMVVVVVVAGGDEGRCAALLTVLNRNIVNLQFKLLCKQTAASVDCSLHRNHLSRVPGNYTQPTLSDNNF